MTGANANELHLPSLSISGFRGIKEVRLPRLGRVTLLAGRNSSGKTTVLEAVRAFAARGRERVLSSLLRGREEFWVVLDEDGDQVPVPNSASLFHGREVAIGSRIAIGPVEEVVSLRHRKLGRIRNVLTIDVVPPDEEQLAFFDRLFPHESSESLMLRIRYDRAKATLPWSRSLGALAHHGSSIDYRMYRRYRRVNGDDDFPRALPCRLLGPGLASNHELAELWDSVVLTDNESRAVDALRVMVGDAMERVALRGAANVQPRLPANQHFMVKVRDHHEPVPLKSLGDGAARLLAASLSLSNSTDGFLLIDEAENGLHYSVHYDYWRMVLRAAKENNVQVLATTHSFSCVRGFAKAAVESDCDGVLVRLDRHGEETKAVSYSEAELEVAAEQGIEVR